LVPFFVDTNIQNNLVNAYLFMGQYTRSLWWSRPAKKWKEEYDSKLKELIRQRKDKAQAQIEATQYANEYLKKTYQNGIMSKGIAQTRSAASYGLMQILYTSAVESRNYPFDTYN
jgi:phage gp46-like protein